MISMPKTLPYIVQQDDQSGIPCAAASLLGPIDVHFSGRCERLIEVEKEIPLMESPGTRASF